MRTIRRGGTIPENFWEDIEQEAEKSREESKNARRTCWDATRKMKEILKSDSSDDIKEICLNDLRDTIARTGDALKDTKKFLNQGMGLTFHLI